MPYHILIKLPDGRVACADYREPVARPMHKINESLSQCKPVAPALYEAVAAWLDSHLEQSAVCCTGLSPRGLPCGHDLSPARKKRPPGPAPGGAPAEPGAGPGGDPTGQ